MVLAESENLTFLDNWTPLGPLILSMGAETSSYKDLQLEEELPLTGEREWTVHDAKTHEDLAVTAFVYKPNANYDLIQNAAKQLKTIRHPSILKFLGLNKSFSGSMLITERVTPLEIALERLTATEIVGGLYNIIEALIFLHDRCGVCHNNICLSSIYVSEDGGWRLGGMELMCQFQGVTSAYLSRIKTHRNEHVIAPEEKLGKVETSPDYGFSRDAFAFGVFAESLLESLAELGDMTKTFEIRVQDEFLHPEPRRRPHLRTLIDDRLFRNEFIEIVQFLKYITLKSEEEKKEFFSGLVEKLYRLPPSLVATRLARPLLSRFVLLDETALQCTIPHLLTPCDAKARGSYKPDEINPILMVGQFKKHVIPELYKIFHVRDVHIRLVLLSTFSRYVHLFDKHSLQKVILPQLLLGLCDTNDELVQASLLAVAELVPILGGDAVIGTNRGKVFSEGIPKFERHINNGPHIKDPQAFKGNGPASVPQDILDKKHKETRTLKELAREKDREKQREEAKRRSEERRQRREQRRNEKRQAKEHTIETEEQTEDIGGDASEEEHDDKHGTVSQHGHADWLEWNEDNHSGSQDLGTNTPDFEGEIEAELQAMSTGLTNFEPVVDTPVHIDWSDVSTVLGQQLQKTETVSTKTRGLMKLKQKSKLSPPPQGEGQISSTTELADRGISQVTPRKSASPSAQRDFGDTWGDDWESPPGNDSDIPDTTSESPTQTSQSLPRTEVLLKSKYASPKGTSTKRVEHQSLGHSSLRHSGQAHELGAEFDIRSIELKKSKKGGSTEPIDFFSDMVPVIKNSNPLADLAHRAAPASHPENSTAKTTTVNMQSRLSFAVMDTAEEIADSWGDDWGDPDSLIEEEIGS